MVTPGGFPQIRQDEAVRADTNLSDRLIFSTILWSFCFFRKDVHLNISFLSDSTMDGTHRPSVPHSLTDEDEDEERRPD